MTISADARAASGTDAALAAPGSADAPLRRWARARPDGVALEDGAHRHEFGLGAARALTFADLDAQVGRLASNFAALGLEPGQVLATQLPNVAESLIVLLAGWRAGLVVASMPLGWRLTEIDPIFGQIAPQAVVTVGQDSAHDYADTMRRAAVDHFSVRFLLGFGTGLPDGVTPIERWLTEALPGALDEPPKPAGPNACAVLTWGASPDGTLPVPRTHMALLQLGHVVSRAMPAAEDATVLGVYPPSTVTGLAGVVMPWLLSGARLALSQPDEPTSLHAAMARDGVTHAIVPAGLLEALWRDGVPPLPAWRHAGCVWPVARDATAAPGAPEGIAVTDIHNLGEIAFLARPRAGNGDPALLPLGAVDLPAGGGGVYLRTRLAEAGGEDGGRALLVRGPAAPQGALRGTGPGPLRPEADGYVRTGLHCVETEADPPSLRIVRAPGLIHHGGAAFCASELDALYAGFPEAADAAAIPVADPVLGERIVAAMVPRPGAILSLDAFTRYLGARQVDARKAPERLILVDAIPRGPDGAVLRDRILAPAELCAGPEQSILRA